MATRKVYFNAEHRGPFLKVSLKSNKWVLIFSAGFRRRINATVKIKNSNGETGNISMCGVDIGVVEGSGPPDTWLSTIVDQIGGASCNDCRKLKRRMTHNKNYILEFKNKFSQAVKVTAEFKGITKSITVAKGDYKDKAIGYLGTIC